MFNLGDRVRHIETDKIGIVIAKGKSIVNNKCLPTTKVKIISPKSNQKNTLKDLDSKWLACEEDYRIIYPNLASKNLRLKSLTQCDRAIIAR